METTFRLSPLVVHDAEQMSYKDRKLLAMHTNILDQQSKLWIQSAEEKKKHIENARKYDVAQDVSWGNEFFIDNRIPHAKLLVNYDAFQMVIQNKVTINR